MATKSRKNKKSVDTETVPETESLTTISEERVPTVARELRANKRLDLTTVMVTQAKVPPSRRLFPSALLSELDELKSRLEEVERVLGITGHNTKET